MNMPNKQTLIQRLKNHPTYAPQFKSIYHTNIFNNTDKAYAAMTNSIVAFENTLTFAPFNSKYDRYLTGKYQFTDLYHL